MKNGSQDQKKIFVLEDHSAIGGLGDRLLNTLTEIGEIIGPTSSGKDRTSPGQAKEFINFGTYSNASLTYPWAYRRN